MQFSTKPDFEQAKIMWDHYWAGDVLKRPILMAQTGKPNKKSNPELKKYKEQDYYYAVTGNFQVLLDRADNYVENTLFLGESVPVVRADHGPDQYAAFFGSGLKFSEDSKNTNWIEPIIEDWDQFLPVRFNEQDKTWQSILKLTKMLADHGKNRYVVGIPDLHSHADSLSALRTPAKLCMDFYDFPEKVKQAIKEISKTYPVIYNELYKAGNMKETGTSCWIPLWCEGKFATIQCDFIYMLGPDIFREFILPAIEEETEFLDHSIFHLDGKGALTHLDDLLSLKKLDVIQWVSGDGNPPPWEWVDLLKKIQKAGKGVWLGGLNFEIIKKLSKELRPKGLIYDVGYVSSVKEYEEIAKWLEKNT